MSPITTHSQHTTTHNNSSPRHPVTQHVARALDLTTPSRRLLHHQRHPASRPLESTPWLALTPDSPLLATLPPPPPHSTPHSTHGGGAAGDGERTKDRRQRDGRKRQGRQRNGRADDPSAAATAPPPHQPRGDATAAALPLPRHCCYATAAEPTPPRHCRWATAAAHPYRCSYRCAPAAALLLLRRSHLHHSPPTEVTRRATVLRAAAQR